MPSESTPAKNESGRWFEKIIECTDSLRSEYQRALHDQAIDHASNLARIDRDVRELRAKIEAVKESCDKLLVKPPECPAECKRAYHDLDESVTRRFGAATKDLDERLKLLTGADKESTAATIVGALTKLPWWKMMLAVIAGIIGLVLLLMALKAAGLV